MEERNLSVVIPTYNRQKTIERAINSVLNQTYKGIEIIVVDDCSTDDTELVVRQMMREHSNISFYKQDHNMGACAARNVGIRMTKTPYISFLDSDDEWLPEKTKKQFECMFQEKADVVFCSVYRIEKGGAKVYPEKTHTGNIYEQLLEGNFISTGMLMGKTACFMEGFDETLPRLQDWDIMIRIAQKYVVKHCAIPLANYYIQSDSISFNHKKLKVASAIIYDKYLDAFMHNRRALAGIYDLRTVGEIMTDGKEAVRFSREAYKAVPTTRRLIIWIACRFGTARILKRLESIRLSKRCN